MKKLTFFGLCILIIVSFAIAQEELGNDSNKELLPNSKTTEKTITENKLNSIGRYKRI